MRISKKELRDTLAVLLAASIVDVQAAKEAKQFAKAWTLDLVADGVSSTVFSIVDKYNLRGIGNALERIEKEQLVKEAGQK